MLKIALTHDIDRIDKTYQRCTHSLKAIYKLEVSRALYHLLSVNSKNPYWGFDEIIKIESSYNVRSTNFFLNESIKFNLFDPNNYKLSLGRYSIHDIRIKEVILYLDKHGWEIGLHGSYNSFANEDLLMSEKKTLENIVGHEIIGVRQHYLNLNANTWENQNSCKLKYDSSFGYNNECGFKDNQFTPFNPLNNNFVVFPQIIMDKPFLNNPDRWGTLQKIFDDAEENDGIVVVNWHNNYFDEKEFPKYKSTYIRLIEEGLKRNAMFNTLGGFYIKKTDYASDQL
jgi:peptidoglycan/xylan/chitin deacetylase (PgdA/CDA1 family)